VSALLAEHGAVIIDADAIAREVVRGGTPGFAAVVERFGPDIVGPDGELDRAKLAEIVFADDVARTDLNGIIHPLVGERSRQLMADVPDDAIVVYDVPLLVENNGAGGFDVVVVVEADLATRLRRLDARGLAEPQARARMAAQASDEQRRAVADKVLHNNGSRDALAEQVSALWQLLSDRETKR